MTVELLRIAGGKANAMSPELLDDIERLIDAFERSDVRAGVIVGYERYFSGGLALPVIIDFDRPRMKQFVEHFARAMTRVLACEKPLVAAINGHAVAGGCVLALMCDYRIATDDPAIRIGLNETQLGIGLPALVVEPLRAQVPAASFVAVALEGGLFAPHDARALGLVDAVAPDALDAAMAKAQTLAAVPPMAAAQVKRAWRAPVLAASAASAARETEAWLDTWFSRDAQQRLRAAVAKLTR